MSIKRILVIFSTTILFFAGQCFAAGANSGFLQDYSGLKADPDRKGAMRYVKQGVSP